MFDAHRHEGQITIRFARPDDRPAIAAVAARDSALPPAEPLLVATVDGEVRAALSLADGTLVADPFEPTAALVEMLRLRAGAGRLPRPSASHRRQRSRPRISFRTAA